MSNIAIEDEYEDEIRETTDPSTPPKTSSFEKPFQKHAPYEPEVMSTMQETSKPSKGKIVAQPDILVKVRETVYPESTYHARLKL